MKITHIIFALIISIVSICPQDNLNSELVAYFPFNGNANDESGNGNHGTVMGATLTEDRSGNLNSAYYFDGIDDYIDIGNDSTLKMSDAVTISVWVNLDYFPLSGWHNIISDHSPSYNNGKIFRFQDNGIEILLDAEGSPEARYNLPDTIAGIWQHLAATYDGNSVKMFVNGILVDSTERIGTIAINPNPLLIGKSGFGEYFPGVIDDIIIYNVGLSNSQVADLYQGNLVSVSNTTNESPKKFKLNQNYPNPFNPSTTISFSIPEASFVSLKIFNSLGEEIATLVSKELNIGNYKYDWEATGLTSGIYFYKLQTNNFIETKKMILIK